MDEQQIVGLDFKGPLPISEISSIGNSEKRDVEGIYLWCVQQKVSGQYLIHYIGESTKTIQRQAEHVTEVLGLNYGIFDPQLLQEGQLSFVWKGMWRDHALNRNNNRLDIYPRITSQVLAYLEVLSIFFAPTELPQDLRKHCEGMIGNHLRKKRAEYASIYPEDNRVILRKSIKNISLAITSAEIICGLDAIIH